jgi:hypothetical protein
MEATRTKTNLGVILKFDALTSKNDISAPFVVHLVVNRLQLDDDGNICLTTPMGLHSFLEAIDKLKSELDGLANDAILWLAGSIASRRVRFAVISNSVGGQKEVRARDGEDSISDAPSPPRPGPAVIQLLPRGR